MAQFMSDALAGFAKAVGGTDEHDDSPHYQFIHTSLLPNTINIGKELRGRKFRVSI
jgi:hypothetical protein